MKLLSLLSSITGRTWLWIMAATLAAGLVATGRHWHLSVVERARVETRDSIAVAARAVQPAQKETVYVAAAQTDKHLDRVATRARGAVEAADAVDSAIAQLSPVCERDSTVTALAEKASALGDSARMLNLAVIDLSAAVITERAARETLQVTSDQIVVTVRDSLRVEQARPKRTIKSNTALVATGVVLVKTVEFTIRLLQKR